MNPIGTSSAAAEVHWTELFKQSEAMDGLMAVARTMYELNVDFGHFLRIHVIVDTNIVCADLLAILRKQRIGARRPAVLELLAKRTLVGYFPYEKLPEVKAKCLELSERYEIPLTTVLELWQKYQRHLIIVPTADLERERSDTQALALRDPTDLPFVQARHLVGASVVLSNDRDLKASGVPVLPWSQVLVDLRHHARHEGLRAALFIAGGTAIVVPLIALIGCVSLIYNAAKKLPPKVLLVAAAGLGLALVIPQSRKFLIDAGKAALGKLRTVGVAVGPVISRASEAAVKAEATAKAMRPALERTLARALSRRFTLTQAAYRVCLVAPKPLTAEEIWNAAQRDGAISLAKQPVRSVLRVLKRHPLVEMLPDGRWQAIAIPKEGELGRRQQ